VTQRPPAPFSALASVVATLLISACGGSPNTPTGSVVNSPGGTPPPPTQLVNVRLTVTVPTSQRRRATNPNYISPATASLAIQLASVNGNGVTGVNATIVNTLPKSPQCKVQNGATVCMATISGSPGIDVFSVTTYDALNATGSLLSVGNASAQIGSGGGGFGIDDRLSIDVNGVIAGLKMRLSPTGAKRGDPVSSAVSLTALDAGGAQIVGNSDYQTPITLAIQGDATGSYALHAPGESGSQLSLVKPTSSVSLQYDGNNQASSITIQAAVHDSDPVSVNAPFTLHGHQPPPPVGTIYALNLGTNLGKGATVTEYDGKARGNAAPLRTLNLSLKLYARSIVVDATGNLYVGYFNSSTGYLASGSPDPGNVVAVFAPGASGNDPPTAMLTADKSTQTTLFPLFTGINATGGLVSYGATTVDGNAGNDSVLTYAAGASGPTPPSNGWNFSFPIIGLVCPECPSGLTLDTAGNFYMAGALSSALGPSYGVFVTAVADIGNPSANPARTIPYDATTQLTQNETTNVSLDSSGEVVVGNSLLQGTGSKITCQGRANVYAAGATGGTTDNPPLRVLVLQGIFTKNTQCASFQSPQQPYFPSIALYGVALFAADDFNNAIDAYASGAGGTVKPSLTLAGPATGLNAPIAVFVSPLSGPAKARPVNPKALNAR
jgi:hypothetical protein